MKIHQLPQGARFEYEGKTYVKTGPLFATGPEGARLIPKYALLTPLDGNTATTAVPAQPLLSKSTVLTAFAEFYARSEVLVPEASRTEFALAREAFLKTIG